MSLNLFQVTMFPMPLPVPSLKIATMLFILSFAVTNAARRPRPTKNAAEIRDETRRKIKMDVLRNLVKDGKNSPQEAFVNLKKLADKYKARNEYGILEEVIQEVSFRIHLDLGIVPSAKMINDLILKAATEHHETQRTHFGNDEQGNIIKDVPNPNAREAMLNSERCVNKNCGRKFDEKNPKHKIPVNEYPYCASCATVRYCHREICGQPFYYGLNPNPGRIKRKRRQKDYYFCTKFCLECHKKESRASQSVDRVSLLNEDRRTCPATFTKPGRAKRKGPKRVQSPSTLASDAPKPPSTPKVEGYNKRTQYPTKPGKQDRTISRTPNAMSRSTPVPGADNVHRLNFNAACMVDHRTPVDQHKDKEQRKVQQPGSRNRRRPKGPGYATKADNVNAYNKEPSRGYATTIEVVN